MKHKVKIKSRQSIIPKMGFLSRLKIHKPLTKLIREKK